MKFIQHINYKGLVPPASVRKASNYRQKTVAYEIQKTDYIQKIPQALMTNSFPVTITLLFGMALVHPSDEYNKKIGAAVAVSNAKDETFEVSRATIYKHSKGRILHIVAHKEFVIGKSIKEFVNLHIHYNIDTKILHSSVTA